IPTRAGTWLLGPPLPIALRSSFIARARRPRTSCRRIAHIGPPSVGHPSHRTHARLLLSCAAVDGGWPHESSDSVGSTLLDTDVARQIPSGSFDDLRLDAGHCLRRYVILQRIGAGAVGVVFAAYDPELDGRIAIKLLHPRASEAIDSSSLRSRLLREAQALARVSHPNVVTVHDVGTYA